MGNNNKRITSMSKIERMLQELCPDGVEYKKLGEIGTFTRGNGLQKKDFTDTGVGCIHYGQIYTYYGTSATRTLTHCSPILAAKLKVAHKGDIIIATTSENIEDVCKAVAWLGDEDIVISGDAYIYSHHQNPKYISYLFQTPAFFNFKKKNQTGTKVIRVSGESMAKFEIPVPPLPVQEEIVRILDHFTALTAELQAELQARQEQYEYYRNRLLMFDAESVNWMKMSEIMDISRGASPRPISLYITESAEGVNWIKIGDVSPTSKYVTSTKEKITKAGAKKSKYLQKGDFILSNSMSFGRPYILKIDGCIHDGWISLSNFDKSVTSDYLYHILRTNAVQRYWKQNAGKGTVSNLNADIVRNTVIPIPPISEQKRIVSILNKFETLVNDLSQGLPAEIAAVQEQYEYYRNKLLTFKRIA